MMRLRHEETKHTSERNAFRCGIAALMVAAAAGCAGTARPHDDQYRYYLNSITRQYGADRIRQFEAGGKTVSVMFLSDTIQSMLQRNREFGVIEEVDPQGTYGTLAFFDKVVLREERSGYSGPTIRSRGRVGVGFLIGADGTYNAVVAFPSSLDTHPQMAGAPGRRMVDSKAFAELYRSVTGQELRRVKLLLDLTTSPITVHMVPADEQGRVTGQYRGGQLAFGVSYFPTQDLVRGGIGLLIEPGGRDPVDGALSPF